MSVIRSVSDTQDTILAGIESLYLPDGYECDITYGNGAFWRNRKGPDLKFDISPQVDGVVAADSAKLPLRDSSLGNVVFDPPFLTYIRDERVGNGSMIMAKRFAGYWSYGQLTEHYQNTLKECSRVLKKKGILVFKCQDIVHNHKFHPTHINVIQWGAECGFSLKDLFVLAAKHRLPSPNRAGKQKHARIFHSYFLVLEKK